MRSVLEHLRPRSMMDFVAVSSDLWQYVLKIGAELSSDHCNIFKCTLIHPGGGWRHEIMFKASAVAARRSCGQEVISACRGCNLKDNRW